MLVYVIDESCKKHEDFLEVGKVQCAAAETTPRAHNREYYSG